MLTPPADGRDRRAARAGSIVWLHYLFAVLTLGTMGASLLLTQSLREDYDGALEEYREWNEYGERVVALGNDLSAIEVAAGDALEPGSHPSRAAPTGVRSPRRTSRRS